MLRFLKARACSLCFQEQICIVQEEQHQVVVSIEKEADIWDQREQKLLELGSIEGQGTAAYAAEQAAICRGPANDFNVI